MVQRSHIYKDETYNYLSKFCSYFDHGFNKEKTLLQSLMGSALALEENGWMLLTKRIIIFFFF